MHRTAFALILVALLSAPAGAQPRRLPLSPGIYPGSSIGPGTQFLPQSIPRGGFGAQGGYDPGADYAPYYVPRHATGFGIGPAALGVPTSYGFGYGGYGFGYGGYGYGLAAPAVIEVVPPAAPLAPPERAVVLANEFPATLTVQFPAAAEVWLNGAAVKGEAAEERVLTSPVLGSGDRFVFDVKALWTRGGKTYEAARAVTLGSGDRSRLLVVSGTEVK